MKTFILILFALLSFGNMSAQTKIYYNYKTKQVEGADDKEIRQFTKNEKYALYVKNYNPVLYKVQASVSQKNSFVEGLKMIMGFITDSKITVPGESNMGLSVAGDPKTDLIKSYKKALELSIYLEDPDIDCTTLAGKVLSENELFTHFDRYANKDSPYKTANKLPDELEINIESVMKLNSLSNQIRKFQTANCATEVLLFTPTKTEVTVEVLLTPLDDKGSLNAIKYSKTATIKGAWHATFSTGLMATSVVKKKYYNNEVSATIFTISEEDKVSILPGIVGLIHISPCESPAVTWNLGVGLDIDKTPHFLTGLSFNFFQDTFLINAGYDLGYLDEITDKYDTDTTYTTKPEVDYKKNLVGGFWFGLTYKL